MTSSGPLQADSGLLRRFRGKKKQEGSGVF
jgi:hypothetical protein